MGVSFITTQLIGMKVPTPYLVFCDITLMQLSGVGICCFSLVRVTVQAPYLAIIGMDVVGPHFFFSVSYSQKRAITHYKSLFFYLFCFVAPFLVLWLKEHAFGGLPFFICAFWHIWVSGFLYPCLVYMEQCKNPGNSPSCHSLGPEFPYLGLPSL